MARHRATVRATHQFRDKLLLNQWLINLFGISPPWEKNVGYRGERPFQVLVERIKNSTEGLGNDNLHHFFQALHNSDIFHNDRCAVDYDQIRTYEENIVRHTIRINRKRRQPVVWKHFQWLTLLFLEIYLDRYFGNREHLIRSLNDFLDQFNTNSKGFLTVPPYTDEDLNKLCFQIATGSGKTLLMHVNILQFRDYSGRHGRGNDLSRIILLTPNERLSDQHLAEFRASDISAGMYLENRDGLGGSEQGLEHVDILEITKLGDEEKDKTIATRSLGDQNLLLVDEGHRGMSGKEEGVWFSHRAELCAKGFTFEYSATFEQAVKSASRAGRIDIEDSYAKAVIFDYSYRWFYEDGFGKDYYILNLPKSAEETQSLYLTACLLKFYQQLRIYEETESELYLFNVEKPLWIFVGTTVSTIKPSKVSKSMITDVAIVIRFIAHFLEDSNSVIRRIRLILTGTAQDTGLMDEDDNDIFEEAFHYLTEARDRGENEQSMYQDILSRFFHCTSTRGHLALHRIKGEDEILLHVGGHEIPFGLISVGDAKGLCDHVAEVASYDGLNLTVQGSDFKEAVFGTVSNTKSPINLLIGSKKFVEGWDCWRVSTMGLMHVGRSEGAQIIQLFGRGVRLKGFRWSLKRSGRVGAVQTPKYIEELETLNVFGIGADFMERFREFLKDEGLPGNERYKHFNIPLNVTYDFGKNLLVPRIKRKHGNGSEYDFQRDAAAVTVGFDPAFLTRKNHKVIVDWYPRIKFISSREDRSTIDRDDISLSEDHLTMLDYDKLCFELEQYKNEKGWYNVNVDKRQIRALLRESSWYTLYLPKAYLQFSSYEDLLFIQGVVTELLKRYVEKYYNYQKRSFFEPRIELRELSRDDENFPVEQSYQLSVAESEAKVISDIRSIQRQLKKERNKFVLKQSLDVCSFECHLYEPLLHIRQGNKISVQPVSLNESENKFVQDLKRWYDNRITEEFLGDLFLLRNLSRGRGIGFFEAGNFHPDFIMWLHRDDKQYISFVEPHGLGREGPNSDKVLFYEQIKDIEKRLNDPNITLNSFILSWTRFEHLPDSWDRMKQKDIENLNVLFMHDDGESYIEKLFAKFGKDVGEPLD